MANSTSIQVLEDGPRNVVVKFEGVLDTSDLASTTVIDPATLSQIDAAFNRNASMVAISHVIFEIEDGLSVNLFWDATTPVRIGEYVGRGDAKYFKLSPLQNNAGTGVTGKITATTQGWASTTILSFIMYIHCVKQ